MVKPAALLPDDTIGILSPAGVLSKERRNTLSLAVKNMEQMGYRVETGRFLYCENGYLAGTDEERAADLNAMLLNPEIKAVFCSRGGYGSARILENLEWNDLTGSVKIIAGYSDITALQLALYRKLGWITFSGPMPAIDLCGVNSETERSFWSALTGSNPECLYAEPAASVKSHGTARGPLLGGCLSVISSMIGTPYCPDFTDAILVLEDIGEDLYKIDRYFCHLYLSGILKRIAGIVLGSFTDIRPDEHDPSITLHDVFNHYLGSLSIPVLADFPYGHSGKKYTLPLGCRVEINADKRTLQFLEKGVL